MVDNKELRIGNWVQTIDGYEKIIGVMDNSAYFVDAKRSLNELEPIPLTPEILEKAGFKYDGYDFMYIDVKLGVFETHFLLNITDNIAYSCYQGNLPLIRNFKYLHDLQNFFYSFWKFELNIQL